MVRSAPVVAAELMVLKLRERHPLLAARCPWLLVAGIAAYAGVTLWAQQLLGVPIPLVGAVALLTLGGAAAVGPRLGVRGLPAVRPVTALAFVVILAMALNDVMLLQSTGLRDLAIYLRAGWLFDYHGAIYLDRADGPAAGRRGVAAVPLSALHAAVLRLAGANPLRRCRAALGRRVRACHSRIAAALRSVVAVVGRVPALAAGRGGHLCRQRGRACAAAVRRWAVAGGSPAVHGGVQAPECDSRHSGWPGNAAGGRFAIAAATAVGLVLVTLPAVGVGRWSEWFQGLVFFEASQQRLPGLYGLALANLIGPVGSVTVGLAVLAFALQRRGREGLARLGLATIAASPSLYSHGFLLGLPAFLRLRSIWFWTAIGLTCSVWGLGWWGAVGIGSAPGSCRNWRGEGRRAMRCTRSARPRGRGRKYRRGGAWLHNPRARPWGHTSRPEGRMVTLAGAPHPSLASLHLRPTT